MRQTIPPRQAQRQPVRFPAQRVMQQPTQHSAAQRNFSAQPQPRPGGIPRPQSRSALLRFAMPRNPVTLMLLGSGAAVAIGLSTLLALGMAVMLISSTGRVLPGVSVSGVALGGLSRDDAAVRLSSELGNITLRDGDRLWQVPATQLGITFDAVASADSAIHFGRGEGSIVQGIFGKADVTPVMQVDAANAAVGVQELASMVDLPARNATIRLDHNELVPVEAENGHSLNVQATVARLIAIANGAERMNGGAVDLIMETTYPTVTDAAPLLERTRALLASPLTVNAYNPVTNQSLPLSIAPSEWGQWLTTENDLSGGIRLSLDGGALTNYLSAVNVGEKQFLKVPEAVKAVQDAVAGNSVNATVRVFNTPTKYTVVPGDTLGTISWKVGIQMFRIQKANPGVNMDGLFPGQTLTVPSRDELLPLPVVPNKRIVVSISRQRMWVYENGQVKWEWPTSTGIASSPTMPGVYQVTSHDGTAYASVWNLYMPYFMSIYEAVPGFYNGIHGFPSRGGSQILWENSLGARVTYGCILLSTANSTLLYQWAENGVITEIQP